MKKEFSQIENISADDFKDEIIKGVVFAFKELLPSVQDNGEEKLLTKQETLKMLPVSLITLRVQEKKIIIPK